MKRWLDHVGVAVRDLDAGRRAFARLGFSLTERSLHSGALVPGGPVEPWASGNHCAMFDAGYLEIIGLTDPDPARFSNVRDLVSRYQGVHIVAIGCDDADRAAAEFSARGAPIQAPRALERDAAWGSTGHETRRAKFRNLYVDRDAYPEARFLVIEQVTPEVLWQPHLLRHANTTVAIDAVYFVADDPLPIAVKFAGLFAPKATVHARGNAMSVPLDRGMIWVTDPASWRSRVPGAFVPPAPAPAGFGVRVTSLATCREILRANGVSVHEGMASGPAASLWVAPEDACGAAIQFTQA